MLQAPRTRIALRYNRIGRFLVFRFETLSLLRFADRGPGPPVPPLPAVARPRSRFDPQCRFSSDLPSPAHNQRPRHGQPGMWLALGRGCRLDRRRDSWLYRAAANSTRAASSEGQRNGHRRDRSGLARNPRSRCPDCFRSSLLENARSQSTKTPRSTGPSHCCLIHFNPPPERLFVAFLGPSSCTLAW